MSIAFIGLGTMGNPMVKNLLKKGFSVIVYDIVQEKIERMVQAGAKGASSSKEAAASADVVITMLPSSPNVEAAVLGKEGILEGVREGAIYIDMSTIDPVTTRKVASILLERRIPMLDAPVTKGVEAAVGGTLTLFIGGEKGVLDKVRDVLGAMGTTLLHMGGNGAGSTTKLVNNLCSGAIVAATAEALVFGAKAGVDPKKLVEAVSGGSGASFALNNHIKEYALKRRFEKVMFPVDFIMKDIHLALQTAQELNMPLPIASLVHEIYAMLKAKGLGKGYYPEVIKIFEEYAGITVQSS